MKKSIFSEHAPKAIGVYSQAIQITENTIYLSGQLGLDPLSGNLVSGGIKAEIEQTFSNIKAVLQAANADFSHIVKLTIYLQNFSDFPVVNEVMAELFKEPYPARTTIGVAALPKGALVEVETIAVVN